MTLAPAAASLDTLTLPPAGPLACSQDGCTRGAHRFGSHQFPRRLSRQAELSDRHVAAALPDGTRRAKVAREYLAAVLTAAEGLGTLRSDGLATVLAVARQLAWAADWSTGTSRPTWARLMDRTGRSRATIHRALTTLQRAGVLGVVASGRQGTWEGQKGEARAENEAAVYVLAVPARRRAVDEDETPRVVTSPEGTYAGAREGGAQVAALRARPEAPSARSVPVPTTSGERAEARPDPVEGPEASPGAVEGIGQEASKRMRRARRRCRVALSPRGMAARELQERVPMLKRSSVAAIAAVIRPWLAAGWSVADVHYAIDWNPDGTRRPVESKEFYQRQLDADRWLMFRLEPWVGDDGTPRLSRGQRSQLFAQGRAEQQRRDREQAARQRAEYAEARLGQGYAAFQTAREGLRKGPRQWP